MVDLDAQFVQLVEVWVVFAELGPELHVEHRALLDVRLELPHVVLESLLGHGVDSCVAFVLAVCQLIVDDLSVPEDHELLIEGRLVLLGSGELVDGVLLRVGLLDKEESVGDSKARVVGESDQWRLLLDAVVVHAVEQLDQQVRLISHDVVVASCTSGLLVVALGDLLFERTVFFVAGLLVDLDVAVEQDRCVLVGCLPRDQLEDEADLVLQLVAGLELVHVDEQQVDSLVSVGDDYEDDKGDANHPGDDAALEERAFHELREAEHDGSPEVDRHKTRPQLRDFLVVVRRVEVELEEDEQTAADDEDQQDVVVVFAAHEHERDDHYRVVEDHQEVRPRIHSSRRHVRSALALEVADADHEVRLEEHDGCDEAEDGVEDVFSFPALHRGEVHVRVDIPRRLAAGHHTDEDVEDRVEEHRGEQTEEGPA